MNSIEAVLELICEAKSVNFNNERICFLRRLIEKDLKVLEILKNKNVDVDLIKNIMKDNRKFECYPDDNLTQEEFNKIKEWYEMERLTEKQDKSQIEKCLNTRERIICSVNPKEIDILSKVLFSQEKKLNEKELQEYLDEVKELEYKKLRSLKWTKKKDLKAN